MNKNYIITWLEVGNEIHFSLVDKNIFDRVVKEEKEYENTYNKALESINSIKPKLFESSKKFQFRLQSFLNGLVKDVSYLDDKEFTKKLFYNTTYIAEGEVFKLKELFDKAEAIYYSTIIGT